MLSDPSFSRRDLLKLGTGAVFVSTLPLHAYAAPDDMRRAQIDVFGDRKIKEGRVTLKMPPIAENGYSVPLDIDVDSPMTETDYVQRIAVFSPRNPIPEIARYTLGPRAGRARVASRIRLAGTQSIVVVAEMNDGSLWSGSVETVVTLAACIVL